MSLDDLFHDRETPTLASQTIGSARVEPAERLKQHFVANEPRGISNRSVAPHAGFYRSAGVPEFFSLRGRVAFPGKIK